MAQVKRWFNLSAYVSGGKPALCLASEDAKQLAMSHALAFLAPLLAVLLPAPAALAPEGQGHGLQPLSEPLRANQVRIEEHVTIRVTPLAAPVQAPNMLVDLPQRALAPRLTERKMGKCLPAAGISGVQVQRDNKLLLFMRDRRIVSAALERACTARDFYSGFYLSRSDDGRLCVDRDTLRSRSGANCKITKIRQLVEE
jgi:hypothetical protein